MLMREHPSSAEILTSCVNYLTEEGQADAARVLQMCSSAEVLSGSEFENDGESHAVLLRGPKEMRELLADKSAPLHGAILAAIVELLYPWDWVNRLVVGPEIYTVELEPEPDESTLLLANTARFLVEGGQKQAASILLACSKLETVYEDTAFPGNGSGDSTDIVRVTLRGPRWAYDLITAASEDGKLLRGELLDALRVLCREGVYINSLWAKPEDMPLQGNWREELLRATLGSSVHNQAADADNFIPWNNLRFRSHTEVRIADALDHAKVLFLPNCRARLNSPRGRVNREADFLVCKDGRWGILEVDGPPFHPPAMAAEDHERQRLFQHHGIKMFQRFTSGRCYDHPHEVVTEFLTLLAKS